MPDPVAIGFIGCGSVFEFYAETAAHLEEQGLARVVAGCDATAEGRARFAHRFPGRTVCLTADDLLRLDVDAVAILVPMTLHGEITRTALLAGKHVLIEKPMATTLQEAAELVTLSVASQRLLVCAPNVVMSGTYQEMLRRIRGGEIGRIHLARARYGSTGPDWGPWYYRRGGGVLFDLAVYPLTSLTGFLGPAERVTALAGTAVPQRIVDGQAVDVEVVDNAQILLDFGGATYASLTGGFTVHTYRSPAIELYGSEGVIQMLGDDWAPEGFEIWRAATDRWESFVPTDPHWSWTDGLGHLVACVASGTEPVMSAGHAFHVLEIMVRAEESARGGITSTIESEFSPV